jgi:hypothetical protein
MLGNTKDVVCTAPLELVGAVEPLLQLLEVHVRQPLAGTWFDHWIALPVKNYYIAVKRRD